MTVLYLAILRAAEELQEMEWKIKCHYYHFNWVIFSGTVQDFSWPRY